VVNNSQIDVVVEFTRDSIFRESDNRFIDYYLEQRVKPNDTLQRTLKGSKEAWTHYVIRSTNEMLNMVIIPYDTLKHYMDFRYIKENEIYEVHSYSLYELEDMNWIIHYPPKN
jgi:hypothetical protein